MSKISIITLFLFFSAGTNILWSMDDFMDGIEADNPTASDAQVVETFSRDLGSGVNIDDLGLIEDKGPVPPPAPVPPPDIEEPPDNQPISDSTLSLPIQRVFQCLINDFQKQIPNYYYARLDQELFKSEPIRNESRKNLKTNVVIVTDPKSEYGHSPFERCYVPIVALDNNEFIIFRKEMQSILDHEVVIVLTDELKEVQKIIQAGGYSEQYVENRSFNSIMFRHQKPLHQTDRGVRHKRLTAVKSVLSDLARRANPRYIVDPDFSTLERRAENSNRFYLMPSNSWITAVQILLNLTKSKAAIEVEPITESIEYQLKVSELLKQYAQIIRRQRNLIMEINWRIPDGGENQFLSQADKRQMRLEAIEIYKMMKLTKPNVDYIRNNLRSDKTIDSSYEDIRNRNNEIMQNFRKIRSLID